jgi:hypothetical protein
LKKSNGNYIDKGLPGENAEMVYIDIENIAGKYSLWREQELEKQKKAGNTPTEKTHSTKIPTWDEWKNKAEKATKELIVTVQKGNKINLNEKIWQSLKDFLTFLFHGKCAYCEGDYLAGMWGDVEHYRPKAKVTEVTNTVVLLKLLLRMEMISLIPVIIGWHITRRIFFCPVRSATQEMEKTINSLYVAPGHVNRMTL